MDKEQLMESARKVKKAAYIPYSKFPVGAALLLEDGTVINGVNVENVSFGATNCAERTAFFTAITNGYSKGDFKAIAIAGDTEDFLPPCSICRQVMAEFCSPEMPVYLTNNKQDILELKLRELLPYAFTELDM
ncbi:MULTISPECIES: cytidine deaminase [unclassified Paenibacillus]|uniref:cytidine deaminase n=1 Tax=unclassified Paenibacillus TaxID=185978 RepID=UPI00240536CE|nr:MULTISPECIES: cytidine deaminase [unclassified Paenibacillus]MDF9842569.1 cytidine deaminase [Paenibacillus sp. PastF-2]MDF9849224.1 cytidine deaminase [Paenibacillus sp. PastM-2]MDF9855729.1 cytidine deaminase [Paenibacillus sp. PastF-1]MDH6481066.1 cytidine deaminase [Paenibacillus sp. PastH-2]MDH6508422.1 cytidine deaminase [Paenibacillus sp. PastM-3]